MNIITFPTKLQVFFTTYNFHTCLWQSYVSAYTIGNQDATLVTVHLNESAQQLSECVYSGLSSNGLLSDPDEGLKQTFFSLFLMDKTHSHQTGTCWIICLCFPICSLVMPCGFKNLTKFKSSNCIQHHRAMPQIPDVSFTINASNGFTQLKLIQLVVTF